MRGAGARLVFVFGEMIVWKSKISRKCEWSREIEIFSQNHLLFGQNEPHQPSSNRQLEPSEDVAEIRSLSSPHHI